MRSRILVVVLVMFLVLALVGCGVITPEFDEAKVKKVINEYFLAISNQNWSKAKNCCVYGSDRYYATCQVESLINTFYQYCNIVTINVYADIWSISIYGNYSEAHLYIAGLVTACGYSDSYGGSGYYYLQKVGNNWKIYAP